VNLLQLAGLSDVAAAGLHSLMQVNFHPDCTASQAV
jgi:hypothetical protein